MTQLAIQQVIYQKFFERGVDGMPYDSALNNIFEAVNPSAPTPFGKLVFQVAGQNGILKMPDGTDAIRNALGVTVFTQVIENVELFIPPDIPQYPSQLPVAIMNKGRIIVIPEQPVAVGDPVYYRTVAIDQAGQHQIQTLALNGVPASGSFILEVEGGFTAAIAWNDSAATIQTKINAVYTGGDAVVTGSLAGELLTIDMGASSEINDSTLMAVSANSLATVTPTAIVVTPAITQNGFPAGVNFNPGDFRMDSDTGNAANANAGGAVIRFKWFAGTDANGFAVLELS
jgi:hypothetical protein